MWRQLGFVSPKSQNGGNQSLENFVEGRQRSYLSKNKGLKRFQPGDHHLKVVSSTKNLTDNGFKDGSKFFKKNEKGQLSIDSSFHSQKLSSLRMKTQGNIKQSMLKDHNQEEESILSGNNLNINSRLTLSKQRALQQRIKKKRQITKKLDQIKLEHKMASKSVKESLMLFQSKFNLLRRQLDNFNPCNNKYEQNNSLQFNSLGIMLSPIKNNKNNVSDENSNILAEYQNYLESISKLNTEKSYLLQRLKNSA